MNANIEGIIADISRENDRDNKNLRITALVDKAKASILRRQKWIKIADRSKDGWKVVEEYESDDLASNPPKMSKEKDGWRAACPSYGFFLVR